MRLRTLRIWKWGKPLWLLLIGWAVVSALMLGLWGYQIADLRGGLPKVDVASSQRIPAKAVQALDIRAEGVAVEVAAGNDVRDIQVQLYGTGYVNQRVVWQQADNGKLTIRLDAYPIIANAYGSRYADNLTMRILLPRKTYDAIAISGDRLNVAVSRCRSKQLTADVAYGSILLQRAVLQRADFSSNTSDITLQHSRIHYLNIDNQEGDTRLLGNKLRYWRYHSVAGDLDVQTRRLNGIWELQSVRGDIHIGMKKWHQTALGQHDLLVELHSDTGMVSASSKKKPWKKTIPAALTAHDLSLLEGRGENMLLVNSKEGNITWDTVKFAE